MENHSFSSHGKNFVKSLGTWIVLYGVQAVGSGIVDEILTNKDTEELKKGIRSHMKDDFCNLINNHDDMTQNRICKNLKIINKQEIGPKYVAKAKKPFSPPTAFKSIEELLEE